MTFIHETAVVLGDVQFGDDCSVWPTAVIRADLERITVGDRTNVQDGAVIHADPGVPTIIGADCVIGHRAIVHGAVLDHSVLIGMGAILLNGVTVGAGSIIGAGALCTAGMQVPAASMVLGVPAKVVRQTSESEQASIVANAGRYSELSKRHAANSFTRQV